MGFTPTGMITPFVRQNQSNNARRPQDLLLTVTGYDLGRGVMLGQYENGEKVDNVEVAIAKETIARNEERKRSRTDLPKDIKWEGHLIDARMASHIEIGSRVVIERAVQVKSFQKDGKALRVFEANRVLNVSDPAPDKTFVGLFTIYAHEGRIMSVQHWKGEKALDVSDANALEKLREEMDDAAAAYARKEYRPTVGAQFRFVNPTGNPDNPYEVLDVSPPFDWIPRKKDEQGNVVSEGQPMTGDKLDELLSQYCSQYIDVKFPTEQYPQGKIEVVPYVNYRASTQNKGMILSTQTWDPLYVMAHARTHLAVDDTEYVQGKNYAVKGIIQLSSDEPDKATKQFKPRNIVNRLHANGAKGHVHAWVRTSDGQKCTPHQALKAVLPQNPRSENDAAPAAGPAVSRQNDAPAAPFHQPEVQSQPAAQHQPEPSHTDDPFGEYSDPFAQAGGDDPFAQGGDDPFDSSAPAAGGASTDVSDARSHVQNARASFSRRGT